MMIVINQPTYKDNTELYEKHIKQLTHLGESFSTDTQTSFGFNTYNYINVHGGKSVCKALSLNPDIKVN